MTKFAQFDPKALQPTLVIGWYDTDEFKYPNLPDASDLIEVTDAQWEARLIEQYHVQDGVLVPKPAPTEAELAHLARFERIAQLKDALTAIDLKRVRPMAEGDADYLAQLNAQAATLRAELQTLQ